MSKYSILEGIRVLDLTRVMSGPFCTSMLADLGAEVIKIEMPGHGDEGRSFGPYKDGESTYFMLLNRDKKSVTIDMKSKEGQKLVKALIGKSDVIVENFRPGVMDRLGLDESSVRKLNRNVIYASISGFGQKSPLQDWPAFDLVIQAMSGIMSLTGQKGGPATAVGESIADVCTGMFAAFGIVAALFDREKTGNTQTLDVAMLDSIMSMQLTGLARQLYSDETPTAVGNRHPFTYPVDSFPTKNGDVVMVCFSEASFQNLSKLMANPKLAEDPRFATNDDRNANEAVLRELIEEWTLTLNQDEVINMLVDAGIPAAPVWDLDQLTKSNHVIARDMIVTGKHQKFGDVPIVPQPVQFSEARATNKPIIPTLGQHTDEILRDILGLRNEEIEELRLNKAI